MMNTHNKTFGSKGKKANGFIIILEMILNVAFPFSSKGIFNSPSLVPVKNIRDKGIKKHSF